jgi:hypothetical protein
MKKALLAFTPLLLVSLKVQAADNTIVINMDKIPENALQQIKPESDKLIRAELDLTNVVVFVDGWKNDQNRKKE